MKNINNIKINKQRGQAFIIAVLFLLISSMTVMTGVVSLVSGEFETANNMLDSRKGLFLSEALNEDIIYRIGNNIELSSEESITLDGGSATATITTVLDKKEILSTAGWSDFVRKIQSKLSISSGASFNYGVQVGNGGFLMENSSSIIGNLYSNGSVEGSGSNEVQGDVVSAGPSGIIDGVRVRNSAYANTIKNSIVDKDAYYETIVNTLVSGSSHPNSPDQATTTLPISDEMVTEWENGAETGGVISCSGTYTISTNTTLGPTKINCNLEINGSPDITLNGPVWVNGNITINNSPTITISPSLGGLSVAIIADNISSRRTSGKISIKNSTEFVSSTQGSYIMLLSQNNDAEMGGGNVAITIENSANGDLLLYAGHGEVLLKNNISLKEVTAYKVHLQNSAQIVYETGLASTLFSSGPGGGYEIESWREVE